MTGSGSGIATGSATLTGTGYLQLGGATLYHSGLDTWFQSVPVIGFGKSDFSCWFQGVPYVDPGGTSLVPIIGTGTCSGSGLLGASIQGSGQASCSGSATLTGTGRLAGQSQGFSIGGAVLLGGGTLTGTGSGGSSGKGSGAAPPPPSVVAYRICSPLQPTLRHFDPVGNRWWSRRVSPGRERQRILTP